jgi:hypothetical protein
MLVPEGHLFVAVYLLTLQRRHSSNYHLQAAAAMPVKFPLPDI